MLCRLLDPGGMAIGTSATEAAANSLQFGFRPRAVDVLNPRQGPRQRPRPQQRRAGVPNAAMRTSPSPVFRRRDQSDPRGIALHMVHYGIEILVAFQRKRLEAALIEIPIADAEIGPLPALSVHVGHPLHEAGEVAVVLRPEDKVPMIGHPAVGTDPHGGSAKGLLHHVLKRLVVLLRAELPHPADAAVENVKEHSSGGDSSDSWHGGNLLKLPILINICACSLYSSQFARLSGSLQKSSD